MRRILTFVSFLNMCFYGFSQDKTLLTINDSIKVSQSEFIRTYKKNNNPGITGEQKNIDEYLELFTNFKLKVLEAERQKLDTNKKFRNEYNGYVKQLSEPYLVDTNVDSRIMKDVYERMKWQVRTSHILFDVGLAASPKDTLVAYQQAMNIRKRILNGENFDSLARKYSKDPSAKQNNGDIGFMDVFSTVYEYENAMYSLPVGSISMPIRTKFGYHIIKITDKKPAKGEIKMAHIIVLPKKDSTFNPKLRIDSAYSRIKAGEDFASVVAVYSDDKRTSKNGGVFPTWINTTQRFPQTFIDKAYAMNVGEISEPFQTEFGWHIIKIIDKRIVMPYDEAVKTMKPLIARDPARNNAGKHSVYQRLKKEYSFKTDEKTFNTFITKVDTSILSGSWKIPSNVSDKVILATFTDQKITEKDFANWIVGFQRKSKIDASKEYVVKHLWDIYVEGKVMNYENGILTKKYPDLSYLLKEYHDGMLLFDLIDKTIWTRSNTDSAGIEAYYNSHKSNYMWGSRVEINKYTCADKKTVEALKKILASRASKNITESQILEKLNKKNKNAVSWERKKYSKGENADVDKMEQKPFSFIEIKDNVVLEINQILAPEPKQLHECRGLVISDYQKILEDEWIKELRKEYKVQVDNSVLNSIKESLK